MLDRYEFEQIIDEELASFRHQPEAKKINKSQQLLSSTAKISRLNFKKIISIGLVAGGLAIAVMHQPSLAHNPYPNNEPNAIRLAPK